MSGLPTGTSKKVQYILQNASKVSYPEAWPGTTVCYSTNLEHVDSWKRLTDTFYTQGKLTWEYTHHKNESVFFSYFPPYSNARHLTLISQCAACPTARVESLGQSLEGREIECISTGEGPLKCWIIHRQHPGETMAEHYAEGLLTRLLGIEMPHTEHEENNQPEGQVQDQVQRLLSLYTFYIVPCMCPDGGVRGHLRTNAAGANLNREWATVKDDYEAPSLERSPEVWHTLRKMQQTGVDVFVDVHGDEELPFNFISGAEHVPNWSKRLETLHGAFTAAYTRANSDMQPHIGYPPMESPEQALPYMNVATNQVSNRFQCLSVTLEMPFKDCLSNPDPERGWTPARSRRLGASVLDPLEYIAPHLRTPEEDLKLPTEDAYIAPTDNYQEPEVAPGEFQMLKKRFFSDVLEIHKKNPTL
eukprot:CAMPEP_0172444896 /NCGR_PEP_ID=MMETSP1065-20121228/4908_1 /TAXON_ID=265537 /ORGANISM="Amphiprora paludosa, Strain CCMP125" /LENGTH=416 /DNA_ID=CAMNT_0013195641 /DNA_START=1 /DNA_END=1251 /DNA_ORIENTATION=+